MNLSLMELYQSMGWFAKSIVIILLFMSLMVMTVAIKKLLLLRRSRKATIKFSGVFAEALQAVDFKRAAGLVQEHPKSHLATAFKRVFDLVSHHARDHKFTAAEVASVQRLIDLNTIEQLATFRSGFGILATVGATAPFVGLLGTTMGVVNAFQGMSAAGTGGLSAITAGIAEALITTAFGLFVAIPAVWLFNYFVNRVDYIGMEINYAAKEFIDFLLRYEEGMGSLSEGGAVLEMEGTHTSPVGV
jgi:biopolymer transport protein ExbB/TolQ